MKFKDFFRRYKGRDKKGFTVIEMIAVVAILAITSTATISVFLAVRDTVRDTGQVTTDQFNISQIEKYIRNELQVASELDIYDRDGTTNNPVVPTGRSLKEDDEYMVYDATNKCVHFIRMVNEGGTLKPKTRLTIDSVSYVSIKITPVNYKAIQDYQAAIDAGGTATDPAKKKPLKLFYEIKGKSFTYSGGMILNNTKAGSPDLTWYTTEPPYCPELLWGVAEEGVTPDGFTPDNSTILVFHSDYSKDTETT